jgi:hypothetical protein
MRPGCTSSASFVSRSSGTVMTPTLGSMVQNGKLAACAFALDRQLNSVLLPTLGRPTIPHFNDIFYFYYYDLLGAKVRKNKGRTKENDILFSYESYLLHESSMDDSIKQHG